MDAWTCPSCGSTATTPYCGRCGERRLDVDASRRGKTAVAGTRSFLGRTLASLRALLSPPGRLTRDWIRGQRVGYLTPISLFLWINVAFFLVQSATRLGILTWPLRAHLADDSISWLTTWLLAHRKPGITEATDGYAEIFDALEAVHAKSLVIVMVPAFALVIGALTLDRREPFRHVFTFATHFFAFSLMWLSLLFPLAAITLRLITASRLTVDHHTMDMTVTAIEALGLGAYLYIALGTVFGLSRLRRSVTTVVLILALYVILKAYHVVVFAVTLYST
jgi:hypothetical protein